MPVRSLRDGSLTIKSVDGAPKTKVVDFMEGGLSWMERIPPPVIHMDRGVLDHARKGSEVMLEGSFSFRYQDDDIRDTLVNLDYAGLAGASSEAQKLYSGWVDPETDATVLSGATLFGRTIQVADVIGGSKAKTDVNGVNLLFVISDPAGGASESILFMAVETTEYAFSEGEDFNQATANFTSVVKQPHIF